jgi:hypothetical protein
MTNSDFLAEAIGPLSQDEYGWICSFAAPPDQGLWAGRFWTATERQAAIIDGASGSNNYFSTAVLSGTTESGQMARTKGTFSRLACLVVDDVDPDSLLGGFSWSVQTSPGKFQVGILLDRDDPDCSNLALVDAAMSALSARGRLGGGNDSSGNAAVRYVRLPYGLNTKPRPAGPWEVRLETWAPSVRWSLADACAAVGLDLDVLRTAIGRGEKATRNSPTGSVGSVAGDALSVLSAPLDQRSYHDAIVRMAASLVAGGMYPGAAVDFLYSLMDQVKPAGPLEEVARWSARRAEIPRAVRSAEKFAPPDRAPAQVTVNLLARQGADVKNSPDSEHEAPTLLLSLHELEKRSAAIRWQVKGLIPDDSLGMMFGASGTFKSFIALDHALHISHGLPWLGRRSSPGPVVYIAAEGGAGIYRRVAAWHKERGLPLADRFKVCVVPLVLSISEHVDALAAAIEAMPERPSLVYVDTLSQTFDGDENSATDISAYLRLINANIRARFQCCVVVIHHSGHAATERPRGSSAITANVDFMLGVYRPDAGLSIARVEVIKQKDGEKLAVQTFELKRVVLGADSEGDEISSLAATHKDVAGPVLAAFAARLSGHEQVLMGLFGAASALPENDLRHKFYDAFGDECRASERKFSQDSARQAWHRTLTALSKKGLLSVTSAGIVRNEP